MHDHSIYLSKHRWIRWGHRSYHSCSILGGIHWNRKDASPKELESKSPREKDQNTQLVEQRNHDHLVAHLIPGAKHTQCSKLLLWQHTCQRSPGWCSGTNVRRPPVKVANDFTGGRYSSDLAMVGELKGVRSDGETQHLLLLWEWGWVTSSWWPLLLRSKGRAILFRPTAQYCGISPGEAWWLAVNFKVPLWPSG